MLATFPSGPLRLEQQVKALSIPNKTVLITATYYNPDYYKIPGTNDFVRSNLALGTVKKASSFGYTVVLVDGLSPQKISADELLKKFQEAGALVQTQEVEGMGPGRRQAISYANNLGKEILAWLEPEKESYILCVYKTIEPILEGKADLVVPKRKSLRSYPTAQQYAEAYGNTFWSQLTGNDLDLWFGPRTWRKELSDYFLNYDGKYGDRWDSLYIPVLDTLIAGKKVTGVEVDYIHPWEQRKLEENDKTFTYKRLAQLNNLIPALEEHWQKRMTGVKFPLFFPTPG